MEQPVTSPDTAAQPQSRTPQQLRTRRRAFAAASALLLGALTLTACGGSASGSDKGKGDAKGGDAAAAQDASSLKITISAKDGSANASINGTTVTAQGGKLSQVTLTEAQTGKAVAGALAADGLSWKPAGKLERGTQYKIMATGKDDKGRSATENAAFTTVTSKNSFIGTYTPDNGSTVGVGMPVSFTFDKPITDKKAVQSHITVDSSSGQQVVGHWFGTQRLDFRPQDYWKAGSKVTLKIALDGVQGASGVYGVQSKTVTFTIGRNQVSTVDAKTQMMTVQQDGKTVKTIPVSTGSAEHTTYNGQMVISEKFTETRMNGATVNFGGEYDIKDVPHAMRLSTSGTFLHGNYWYKGNPFGNAGTSHGCVGLRDVQGAQGDTPAKWFFDHSLIGDVVTVKGSPDKTIAPDNGLNGWNMPWSEWQAGSAA
ncbi:L,D-transpeptidase [Streptomyces melanogenes]|uniref:L,D-transpeptidase n=1 Tax=Streptomyces melanogenes TaxID=67326 RepID=UPI00167E8BCD|nr:Ig-like domain-containing protein [Streptomyces melanogenes]